MHTNWRFYSWFSIVFFTLFICEIILLGFPAGYLPNKLSFVFINNLDIIGLYFQDNPLNALKFVLIDTPVFTIESWQTNGQTAVWGLHYYAYSLLVHIVITISISMNLCRSGIFATRVKQLPITGLTLLLMSSLYLYLASCCTSGANWFVHTLLLAFASNPALNSAFIMDTYVYIRNGLTISQFGMAIVGLYLVYKR